MKNEKNNTPQPKTEKCLGSPSHLHCFSLVNYCVSVVLQLDTGVYHQNVHVVTCPDKY